MSSIHHNAPHVFSWNWIRTKYNYPSFIQIQTSLSNATLILPSSNYHFKLRNISKSHKIFSSYARITSTELFKQCFLCRSLEHLQRYFLFFFSLYWIRLDLKLLANKLPPKNVFFDMTKKMTFFESPIRRHKLFTCYDVTIIMTTLPKRLFKTNVRIFVQSSRLLAPRRSWLAFNCHCSSWILQPTRVPLSFQPLMFDKNSFHFSSL